DIRVRDKVIPDEKINADTLLLVDFRSPLLPEVLRSLLYRSDNMFTEMTLRAVAAASCKQATIKNGVAKVNELWRLKGVDTAALFMRDGSGLSRNNKASARFLCEMLRCVYADRDSLGCDFSQLLPVGGVSGTLKSLLGKTPLCGRVALKSGSMSDVQCFAGYFPADSPKYSVTVLVNNFLCPRSELRRNIEQMLVELFSTE
ncbi:MAG: D-alanyl-D-alanine carboxypeptidase, partial [Muribaculaceae bacterium]